MNENQIVELNTEEVEAVNGAALFLLAVPLLKGFVMGAGTVAAGAAVLDAAGVADFW